VFLEATTSANYAADVAGIVATKICGKCKQEKQVTLFSLSKRNKSGFNSYCKSCDSIVGKERMVNEKVVDKVIPTHRTCCSCKTVKLSKEFSKCASRKDGLDIRCKPCASKSSKVQHYKKLYGFTAEQAKNHLENQHGSCKICGNESKLYGDHNHSTGKVRGLICNNCNTVLGHSKERIDVLLKAIDYLKEYA
jgi:hypothetical protein